MSLRILLVTAALLSIGVSIVFSQTDILPYASESDLGKLIGQNARLEGVFHYEAFGMPAIAISGRVFYLLENPPSKRTFEFPQGSRYATITGTLYLYDGNIQRVDAYQRIGPRYYFFNIDEAKIQLEEPIKATPGAAKANPMSNFYGSWRLDYESMEAEIFGIEDEFEQAFMSGALEGMKDFKVEVHENRIITRVPKLKKTVNESYSILSMDAQNVKLSVKNPIVGEYQITLSIDSEDRMVMIMEDKNDPDDFPFTVFYNRW